MGSGTTGGAIPAWAGGPDTVLRQVVRNCQFLGTLDQFSAQRSQPDSADMLGVFRGHAEIEGRTVGHKVVRMKTITERDCRGDSKSLWRMPLLASANALSSSASFETVGAHPSAALTTPSANAWKVNTSAFESSLGSRPGKS